MYYKIIKSVINKNFNALSHGDYEILLNTVSDNVQHSFLGNSAIGGQRKSKNKLRLWFKRVYRLFPMLVFNVSNIVVSGFPWHTTVVVEWTANVTPHVGDPYINSGAHVIILKWGKAVKISAYENSELVAIACQTMINAGVEEAGAAQIN